LVVVSKGAPRLLAGLRQLGLKADVVGAGAQLGSDSPEATVDSPVPEAAQLVVHVGETAQTDAILDSALVAEAPILRLVSLG
jgi:hypothetical protein